MNLTPESKVLIQGITEPLGAIHAARMKTYGTNIVAGVSPGQGGTVLHDIPIFDLVEQALATVGGVDTTILFLPPYLALDGAFEAIAAGIQQVILVTEGIPPLDMVRLVRKAESAGAIVLGPSCSGIIVPGKTLLGTHPGAFYTPGAVGLIGRSPTLTHEVALTLTQADLGQSFGVTLGNSSIVGSSFPQWLQRLEDDALTQVIVLVGELGGNNEEVAARYISHTLKKSVVAYIAGCHIPAEKQSDYADAIHFQPCETILAREVSSDQQIGTAISKLEAFKQAKIPVARRPSDLPKLVRKALKASSRKTKSS